MIQMDLFSAWIIAFYILGGINGFIVAAVIAKLFNIKKMKGKIIVDAEADEIEA